MQTNKISGSHTRRVFQGSPYSCNVRKFYHFSLEKDDQKMEYEAKQSEINYQPEIQEVDTTAVSKVRLP